MTVTIPRRWADVTLSDSATIPPTMGLFIGSAGNVRASGMDGVAATFPVSAGQYLSGRFTQIFATGTNATGIVALYAD